MPGKVTIFDPSDWTTVPRPVKKQTRWQRLMDLMWKQKDGPPRKEHKKGYQSILLSSKDGRKHRNVFVKSRRVSDKHITKEPIQKAIKDMLSQGWKPQGRRWFTSAVNDRGKTRKRAEGKAGRRRDMRQYRKYIQQRYQKEMSKQQSTGHSFERSGQLVQGENLDININEYSLFISLLSKMQQMGGGKKFQKVGIDIEPFELAIHMLNKLDFEPYLYTDQLSPMRRMLLTVDASGSCTHLIPLTRALGKKMAAKPNLELTYSENYNGDPNEGDIQDKVRHGYFDFVFYFGDTDCINSFITRVKTLSIMFLTQQDEGRQYYEKQIHNDSTNYYTFVDFNKGASLSEGLQLAIDYFKDKRF